MPNESERQFIALEWTESTPFPLEAVRNIKCIQRAASNHAFMPLKYFLFAQIINTHLDN